MRPHTTTFEERLAVLTIGDPSAVKRLTSLGDQPKNDGDPHAPALWFKVLLSSGAIGHGKIDLLRLVAETGSVSAAARRMRMSHVRSVKLVAELNILGPEPLIRTRSGGETGGGSTLTEAGRAVLMHYDALDQALRDVAASHLERIEKALSGE